MTKHCDKHSLNYEVISLDAFMDHFETGCPKCAEEYDEMEKREKLSAARELERKERMDRAKAMNIEPRFYDASFDNYVAETPEQKNALDKVQKLVNGEIETILMLGSNGTGKTHLAVAALWALGGRIMTVYEIATTIRASYGAKSEKTELELVDEMASLPLLCIDEIGRTKGSDAELGWLSYLIDKRWSRNLPLLMVSNKHIRKTCPNGEAGCPDCINQYLGNDSMSRISDHGILVNLSGEDWRRRK